ncbi:MULTISPECIES: flagellar hook-basal body complex protein FliE [Sphingobium]|jgi:flagellar hook-basal body complex protein FliE|uniref:Flagellar hook-basal body complex protein FliE n=1 Tax=Sphingobium yanoikuyae TaxID=13690 RepID=A0A085K7W8_SPHYA|nr:MULTISPECIES: flagellar hook-basal body complex protein FliE [Sphingobium]RSU76638.1 flagellar hook-basal body complex protein FliE [Sphingomonas sp. S-NIH.Pt3_0716]AYO78265.1 flagellar hook-basal body complex protein FliE [Sphingobium yanoikuyae]KFD28814.1 flagellar hook-basal body protein FliE [Sphingobium yanoikuyae]KZC82807.1 flagellar hook-basal body protein FliE [Sphingobium yanoikuyae]MBO9526662.1 flagellar hook-basal body complex protein FliE [Sphingobium yanoikuyae]
MTGISPTDSVMAMRNAILQKNAALRDVASTGNVGSAGGAGATQGTAPGGFTDALNNALQQVNGLQTQAGDAASAFERGETTDIAAVMLAKQQASVSFEATLQVRNKLLSAYKDIMSMPV